MIIFSSNQTCLDNATIIYYSPQKDLFNNLLHAQIGNLLTLAQRWFVVENQISNLTPSLSFDHNSCISYLNEQWDGTLGIYTSKTFQWYFGGPICYLFAFSTKALNIQNSCMSATLKMGVHLGGIGFHFLHYIPFARVFHIWTHFLSFMGPCIPHLLTNPMLGLRQMPKSTSKT
jgi:hypothetical protein